MNLAINSIGVLEPAIDVAGEPALVASVYGVRVRPRPAAESSSLIVDHRLSDLVLGIHHEWTVLSDRLHEWATLQHQ